MKIFFRLFSFCKPYSRFVPAYAFYAIGSVVFGVFNFAFLIPLLDVLFGKEDLARLDMPTFAWSVDYFIKLFKYYMHDIAQQYGRGGALVYVCIILFTGSLLTNFFRFSSQRVLVNMRTYLVQNIRNALFKKIVRLHLGFFHNERKGNIMSLVTNDVQEVEYSVVSSYQVIFRDPLTIVVSFIFLFLISWKLSLFTLILLPISGFFISMVTRRLRSQSSEGQKMLGMVTSVLDETLGAIRVIIAFGAAPLMIRRFEKENNDYTRLNRKLTSRRELASPLSEFLGITVAIGILIFGAYLVFSGTDRLTASGFITFLVVYSQVITPAKAIAAAIATMQKGIASGERILEFLDAPVQVDPGSGKPAIGTLNDKIEIRDLSFAYGEEPVLNHINLTINKGESVALVGSSGSGKSTLADLIIRYYDPQSGGIYIDDKDLREIDTSTYHKLLGVVSQEAVLFHDTIAANIAFGKPEATMDEIVAAAKIAHAHEFIEQMEEGYQTMVGDRGVMLSGGQRQRISIARAVVKNPAILVLDEATSALDSESEKLVQQALNDIQKERTSIVIAHRLSTIAQADKIVVMEKGEIAETGRHEELIAKNGIYARLWAMQAGGQAH